jgi:hypothetical protein
MATDTRILIRSLVNRCGVLIDRLARFLIVFWTVVYVLFCFFMLIYIIITGGASQLIKR